MNPWGITEEEELENPWGIRPKKEPGVTRFLRGVKEKGPGLVKRELGTALEFLKFPYTVTKELTWPMAKSAAKLPFRTEEAVAELGETAEKGKEMAGGLAAGGYDWLRAIGMGTTPAEQYMSRAKIGERVKEHGVLAESVHPLILMGMSRGFGVRGAPKRAKVPKLRPEAEATIPLLRRPEEIIPEIVKKPKAKKIPGAEELRAKAEIEKAIAEKVAVKEPWEMTRREYIDFRVPRGRGLEGFYGDAVKRVEGKAFLDHANAVREAIKTKKPVPPEVLKDYPELKPKPALEGVSQDQIMAKAAEMLEDVKLVQKPVVTKLKGAQGVQVAYDPATTAPWFDRVRVSGGKAGISTALREITKKGSAVSEKNRFMVGEVLQELREPTPPSMKGYTTRLYTGLDPKYFGEIGKSIQEVSRLTSEMVEGMKAKPEIRTGVKESKLAMIEHDRQIRGAESTSKLFEKTIKDVVPDADRQMLMVHAYEHKMKGKYWDQLTDLEQSMVGWVGKEKAKLTKFIKENDILEMMPESESIQHIFHHWIDPKTGQPYKGMYGKFSKGLPQAKQRVIPSYESGIAKGLEPATTNIGKLIGLEWEAVTRAHQSREMFKTLHNIGAEKGVEIQLMKGKPTKPIRMVERWDLLQKQGLTEDYTRYSYPALDKAIIFKDVNGALTKLKGAVGVRKELYPFVQSYLESPNYGTLSKLNFATKSLKLGFSLFHVMSLGMQELANFRIPFKNIPRGLREIKNLSEEMRILHKEGLEIFKGYEDVGYRNRFFEGSGTWSKMGNTVTKPIEMMRTFIFDIVQPGMKASFALDKYNELLPKYLKRGLTKEQCARDVVKAADGHFSGEHYKRSLLETNRFMVKMYFTPEARKTWQAALLSPTWQREHLLVAKNVAKSFMPDKMIRKLGLAEMGPVKAEFRKYLLGAAMIISAVDLWNYQNTLKMDGKGLHLWENPPGKGFAVRAPWNEPGYTMIDKNGKERRVQGGPGYIRPLKSVFEVAEWVKTPFKKFVYKLSPIMTATGRQMWPSKYQKEYKGWPDMDQRVWDFITDVGTPISASQMARWWTGKKTLQSAIIPFFGAPTSRLSRQQTPKVYYQRLAKLQRKHGRFSNEWKKVRTEFESMGYKFNEKTYRTYREPKKQPAMEMVLGKK